MTYRFTDKRYVYFFFFFFLKNFIGYLWHRQLYIFKVYDLMFWHMYTLWKDHSSQAKSFNPSCLHSFCVCWEDLVSYLSSWQILSIQYNIVPYMGFPGVSASKKSAWNVEDLGSVPGSGRPPGEGNGNPLENPWTEEPGGLRSVGLQRMGLNPATHFPIVACGHHAVCSIFRTCSHLFCVFKTLYPLTDVSSYFPPPPPNAWKLPF